MCSVRDIMIAQSLVMSPFFLLLLLACCRQQCYTISDVPVLRHNLPLSIALKDLKINPTLPFEVKVQCSHSTCSHIFWPWSQWAFQYCRRKFFHTPHPPSPTFHFSSYQAHSPSVLYKRFCVFCTILRDYCAFYSRSSIVSNCILIKWSNQWMNNYFLS